MSPLNPVELQQALENQILGKDYTEFRCDYQTPILKMKVPRKILIVDDECSIRTVLETILTAEGYVVVSVPSGEQALKLVRNEKFHLVITDLIMPGSDGIEIILSLRGTQPDLRIIAMSGGGAGGAENYLPLAATLGARYTLAKPFGKDELLRIVRKEISPDDTQAILSN